jgi:hypothetical protein
VFIKERKILKLKKKEHIHSIVYVKFILEKGKDRCYSIYGKENKTDGKNIDRNSFKAREKNEEIKRTF